LSVKLKIEFRF